MLRTTLAKAYIKRTIRPLYGWTQATPKSSFLKASSPVAGTASALVYPGFALVQTADDEYDVPTATTDKIVGLCGLYIGGDGINEPADSGINAIAVWVLGSDAEFEILAPAFDSAVTPHVGDSVYAYATSAATGKQWGQLVTGTSAPTGATTQIVAKVVKVNSSTKITIRGLIGTV